MIAKWKTIPVAKTSLEVIYDTHGIFISDNNDNAILMPVNHDVKAFHYGDTNTFGKCISIQKYRYSEVSLRYYRGTFVSQYFPLKSTIRRVHSFVRVVVFHRFTLRHLFYVALHCLQEHTSYMFGWVAPHLSYGLLISSALMGQSLIACELPKCTCGG